ncbi:MAG: exodeoxyribonuclease III [Rhodospirillaceae bacterium TMED167]|nr:exodeoxyribonuclease III [Rhodospirillaceae bacterium]OUW24134.1 MAG: exodeoxyribonuclease III [Rhodospirillaceae bacterium TMED167]
MKITTWNINSVRSRLKTLAKISETLSPDVICLQEIKVMTELFPADEIAAMGYPHQAVSGMKAYNGVAILSKKPFKNTGHLDWCGKNDARHVFAVLPGNIELHNVYVPAGGDVPDPKLNDKFDHKLKFLRAMTRWGLARQETGARRILVGDLNIAPLETDVWSHKQLLKIVSHTPVEVALFEKFRKSGPWMDAVRQIILPHEPLYSWWSYRSKDWSSADKGRRLDHIWVTAPLADSIVEANVLREARGWDRPSDHAPVTVTLTI